MVLSKLAGLFTALAAVGQVAGHGYVSNIIINGVSYTNYNPNSDWYQPPASRPVRAGWAAEQMDLGFVAPNAYGSPDIICHRQATPGQGHIRVAAGDVITLQWTDWPESHKGPVFDHLARCDGHCSTANKQDLRWFKIDGAGLVSAPNTFAADLLVQNSDQWSVRIPSNVAPGHYVLRHEILALHSASQPNGAQSYPQCINLEITGSGSSTFPGTAGTQLLSPNEAGVVFNVWAPVSSYPVPGGAIVQGGTSMIPQSVVRATATGTVTPAGQATPPPGPPPTNPPPTNPPPTNPPPTNPPPTNPPPTNPPPSSGGAPHWGQCGGQGWPGPHTCQSGATCTPLNDYYHQCIPN
ncbi:endoglucanase-4 [Sodiomyces alkalinus F11]|uniref:lytic cellulose monooxygenase (C4-dehydrogenating) n=1 Tax=Sodiomyces alkalinus (strain CBS 110278 / VKM F-3762 / F11) TaxID=1314773 RepID=A0A3N2PX77_SODAK|nr:endoglucanase-4 [Sodiomyces alkalinus F11]ROT39097.1 endoglucanase-4 [Sodiomyces alkalinus F11]